MQTNPEQYQICKLPGHAWEPIAAPDKVACRYCQMPGLVKNAEAFWEIVDQAHIEGRRMVTCVSKRSGTG